MNMQEYFDSLHPAERARVSFKPDSGERLSDEERTSRLRLQNLWERLMRGERHPRVGLIADEDVSEQLSRFLGRGV